MSKIANLFGGGESPSLPEPRPLSPPPKRDDPAIAARRAEERLAAKRRRGRASTRIADQGAGQLGDAPVNRPGLRTSRLLGG